MSRQSSTLPCRALCRGPAEEHRSHRGWEEGAWRVRHHRGLGTQVSKCREVGPSIKCLAAGSIRRVWSQGVPVPPTIPRSLSKRTSEPTQASFLSHVIPSLAESVGRARSKIIYGHGQSLDFVRAFSCDVFFAFSAFPSDLFVKCHCFGSGVRTMGHLQIFLDSFPESQRKKSKSSSFVRKTKVLPL